MARSSSLSVFPKPPSPPDSALLQPSSQTASNEHLIQSNTNTDLDNTPRPHEQSPQLTIPQFTVGTALYTQPIRTHPHFKRAIFDTFSFFFEEPTPHDGGNMIEKVHQTHYYHYCLRHSFPPVPPLDLLIQPKSYTIGTDVCCSQINQILFADNKAEYLAPAEMTAHVKHAWLKLEQLNSIVHGPSFDIQACTPVFSATLVYLGLVIASKFKRGLEPTYRRLIDRIFDVLVAFEAKEQYDPQAVLAHLNYYQALALLKWHNYTLVYSEKSPYNPVTPKAYASLSRYAKLGSAFHATADSQVHLGNAIVNSEAYRFLPGRDPADQWATWITHESLIRTTYLLIISETVAKYVSQISFDNVLVDSDLALMAPHSMWTSVSSDMFFHTVGPQRSILTISFLLVLKSMLRLPPIGDDRSRLYQMRNPQGKVSWSAPHTFTLLYGLMTIGWIIEGCKYYQQNNIKDDDMDRGYYSESSSTSSNCPLPVIADPTIQSRFYYALNMYAVFNEEVVMPMLQTPDALYFSAITGDGSRPVPWDGVFSLFVGFQNMYNTMYTMGAFETALVKGVTENLKTLAHMPVKSWSDQQIETYIMFGTIHPDASALARLNTWVDTDNSYNRLTLAGFCLMCIVNASNPLCIGGAELVSARAMHVSSVLILWAFDYQVRLTHPSPTPPAVTYTDYQRACLHRPSSIDPLPLLKQHYALGESIYKVTMGLYVNPHELAPRKLVARTEPEKHHLDRAYNSAANECTVFSVLAALSYIDDMMLKLDPAAPACEILTRVREVL